MHFFGEEEKRLITRIEEDLKLMDFSIEPDPFGDLKYYATHFFKNTRKLDTVVRNKLKKYLSEEGKTSEETEEIAASLTENAGELTITFNKLPSARISSYEYMEQNQMGFRNALEKVLKSTDYQFKEKCVVAFLLYYKEENRVDVDNYNLKGILDWLTVFLFGDDNPKFVSEYISGIPLDSGEEYLQIRVIPVSKWKSVLPWEN